MKVAFLGDIGLFGRFSLENGLNLKNYFQEVSELLNDFDLVVGNLETPFIEASMKPYGVKSAHISSCRENIDILRYLNVGIVNLAKNNILDYGVEGYNYTKSILEDANILWFGLAKKTIEFKSEDSHLHFSGYCAYNTSPLGIFNNNKKIGVDKLDFDSIKKRVELDKKNNMLSVLSVHSGIEHTNYPDLEYIDMARLLSKAGSFILHGHHPHVLQGFEQKQKSLIAYSLGNFCFDDVYTGKSKSPLIKQSENNKSSVILSVEIKHNQIKEYTLIPIYMGEDSMEIGNANILKRVNKYSDALSDYKGLCQEMREQQIRKYYGDKRLNRNVLWYLKRLRFSSFLLLMDRYFNKRNQDKHVTKKIKNAIKNE